MYEMGAGLSSTSYNRNRSVYTMPSNNDSHRKTVSHQPKSTNVQKYNHRVSVRNFGVTTWFIPPGDATVYEFRPHSGHKLEWNITSDHTEFVSKFTDTPGRRFFKGMVFKVFYAIKDAAGEKKYVFKTYKSITPTIANVMLSVKNTAIGAIAMRIQTAGGKPALYDEVFSELKSTRISSILVRTKGAKHIYVDAITNNECKGNV